MESTINNISLTEMGKALLKLFFMSIGVLVASCILLPFCILLILIGLIVGNERVTNWMGWFFDLVDTTETKDGKGEITNKENMDDVYYVLTISLGEKTGIIEVSKEQYDSVDIGNSVNIKYHIGRVSKIFNIHSIIN